MEGAEKRKVNWAEKAQPIVAQKEIGPQPTVSLNGLFPSSQDLPESSVSRVRQLDDILGSKDDKSISWEVGEGSGDHVKVSQGFLSAVAYSGMVSEGSTNAKKFVGLFLDAAPSAGIGMG